MVDRGWRRGMLAFATIVVMCGCKPSPSSVPTGPVASAGPTVAAIVSPTGTPGPKRGGTVHLLNWYPEFNQIDPQRIYTYEDEAFFGATLYRSLVTYASSPDPIEGTTLVPDLATDLGRPTDGARTWSFTLRDGVTFQDGSAITCEDVKYGVSRTFANDLISQGPTYVIAYLDIPPNPITDAPNDPRSTYLSAYYGPYDGTGQDLFDKAVECSADHRTITFQLKQPVGDFNATTTIGFSPVPKEADSNETYGQPGHLPVSSGPYQVASYTPGSYETSNPGSLVLVRNLHWDPASDPVRHAYPDRWVVDLGLPEADIDPRLIASAGDDAYALDVLPLETDSFAKVFSAPDVVRPAFAGRAFSGDDPYARYDWIDTTQVPNLKLRQAMMVALDRQSIREILGGPSWGTFADGVVKPSIGKDYAPTGIWDTYFGQQIPDSGDPALAKRLVADSGETAPALTFRIPDSPTNQKVLAVVQQSLGKAGFKVEWDPPCEFCAIEFNGPDFGTAGWGADWPSASTVIAPLFTLQGGWDLSKVDDAAFNTAVADAVGTVDRTEQAGKWQALNKQAVENAWVIPTFFGRQQRLAGTKIGGLYLWSAYSSWPYADLYVME